MKLGAISIVVVAAVTVLPAVLLLGPLGGSDTDRLTAVLTFIGALVGASVALIGLMLNYRTEHRLAHEQEEQQGQLKLDAAMRAGQLMSPTEAGPAHPAAVASGLLALTNLGRADLAVALLVDLWSENEDEDRVSKEAAILVIDAALRSASSNAQLVAAEVLCRNAKKLDACQSLHWPSKVDGRWNQHFSDQTKLLLIEALVRMTKTSPAKGRALRSVAVRLYGIWQKDPDPRVKRCIGKFIFNILGPLKALQYTEFVHGCRTVTIGDLAEAAESAGDSPDSYLAKLSDELSRDLHKWASSCQAQSHEPGALAHAAF